VNNRIPIVYLMYLAAPLWCALGLAAPVGARNVIDCPLRDQAYSVDSPLIDVLLKPEAKAIVEREAPALLKTGPPMMQNTTPPTFASILSLRILASFEHVSDDSLSRILEALAALPITDADRTARCARYDNDQPILNVPKGHPRLLLFDKINGFRDEPSVEAANAALRKMAERNGWALVATNKGGAITAATLKKFDAVIWNNVSGDVLTLTERSALRRYIEGGGGFVAFHGAAGDPAYFWDWYVDTLIGARFIGHPMSPQFQEARVVVEDQGSIAGDLAPGWRMTDEWYSFETSPRKNGAHIIATLDESTYSPIGMGNQDLRMGDHPIAWTRCVGKGRSFYSAIGHRPETYSDPHYETLLEHAILWAAGTGDANCK
jgi:type 1 glutamine amidotransferase